VQHLVRATAYVPAPASTDPPVAQRAIARLRDVHRGMHRAPHAAPAAVDRHDAVAVLAEVVDRLFPI